MSWYFFGGFLRVLDGPRPRGAGNHCRMHRPGRGDALPGEGRLYAVQTRTSPGALQRELTDHLTSSRPRRAEYLRPESVRQYPRNPPCLSTGWRPAGVRTRSCSRDSGASYGIYSGFELCERRAVAAAAKSTWTPRNYQFVKRDWSARVRYSGAGPARQPRPARRIGRCSSTARCSSIRRQPRTLIAYSKTPPETGAHRLLMSSPRSSPHAASAGSKRRSTADVFRVCDLLDEAVYTCTAAELRAARIGLAAGHILKVEAP